MRETGILAVEVTRIMRRSLLIGLLPYFIGVVALFADQAQKRLAPHACERTSLLLR